jgi:hypothetical protein
MLGNKKGNVMIASVILAAALCFCTVLMLYGLKKFQNNMISYASAQKADVIDRLRDQKNEAKKFVWNREARMRDFVRKEMKSAKLELDNAKK